MSTECFSIAKTYTPIGSPIRYDNAIWDSAAVAYGGPLGTCYKLGVKW